MPEVVDDPGTGRMTQHFHSMNKSVAEVGIVTPSMRRSIKQYSDCVLEDRLQVDSSRITRCP